MCAKYLQYTAIYTIICKALLKIQKSTKGLGSKIPTKPPLGLAFYFASCPLVLGLLEATRNTRACGILGFSNCQQ